MLRNSKVYYLISVFSLFVITVNFTVFLVP